MTAMWVLGFPRAPRRFRILNPRFCGWIVLSTLRRAFDLDFRSVVFKDACFDADQEVHRVLTEKVFPVQTWVAATDEFVAAQKG
jgi:isochorismate hydrolase